MNSIKKPAKHWRRPVCLLGVVSAVACSSLMLSACSEGDTTGQDAFIESEGSSTAQYETPAFGGPWSEDFTRQYQHARSDFIREVLADEVITDQELAETRDKFVECMSAHGFTNISFDTDGSFEFSGGEPADSEDQLVAECSETSGESSIGALHSWIRRNPENLDEDTIMAACLVRKGVVEPSYSAKQFADEVPDINFPYNNGIAGEIALLECSDDPLGLFE